MSNTRVIRAGAHPSLFSYLLQVAKSQSLVFTLAKRDIQIKYSQSVLGVFWVILQPVLGVCLFTLVIGRWMKMPSLTYPYPLFAFSGLIGWNFFTYVAISGGTSLSESRDIIKRIAFPKLVLPLSKVLVALFDLLISVSVLLAVSLFSGVAFSAKIFLLPVFVAVLIATGLSLSIWLCALTIRFNDFNHIVSYLVNFGIWVTPVFYSIDIVPERYRFIMHLNPVTMGIEGIRWCIFQTPFVLADYGLSLLGIAVILFSGLLYFRHIEKRIPDTI